MIKKINKIVAFLLNKDQQFSNSISRAAFLISFMGLTSRALGLLRDRILASRFGAGDDLDIYYAAFKIPDLVFNLLILGALSAAFVPVFTSLISRGKKRTAWKLASQALTLGSGAMVLAAFLLYFLAPFLVKLITFGFNGEKQATVTALARIMLLSPVLLGISGIVGGILNSFKKFFFYSLAPLFYNLGIIIGALFFVNFWGLKGLAWGVVLGAFLHLAVQLPQARRCGLKFQLNLNWRDKHIKRMLRLMLPRAMGLAVTQINLLIVTILASTLESGSLAIFNLANNIQSVPLGLFGISFAIAAFPTLSATWAQKNKRHFIAHFSTTFRNILFLTIPFSVAFIVLRAQIVRIVLGAGKFDWEDTILAFQALGIFSVSLFAQSLIPLLARSFYALHNTKIPFMVGFFSEAINLMLALLLIKDYQVLGLVWAFSVSTIVNMFLLLAILRRKLEGIDEARIIQSVWKILLAAFLMAGSIQGLKYGVSWLVDMHTFWGVFLQLIIAAGGGAVVFIATGKWLKIKELERLWKMINPKAFLETTLNGK